MELLSHIQEAFNNLVTAKLRSFLAVLGILVGSASVVAMVSSGQLATNAALAQFTKLGTNLLSVNIMDSQQNQTQSSTHPTKLSINTAENVQSVSNSITDVAPYITTYGSIVYEGHAIMGEILGVTQSMENAIKIDMAEGRFISDLDDYAYFCVIGAGIADNLKTFGGLTPLGQQILLGSTYYTIVGVASDWPENSFMDADINQSILVSIDSASTLSSDAQINQIIFTLAPNSNIDATKTAIAHYINKNLPGKQLEFRSAEQLLQSMENERKILTLLLGLIGSISLVVGGIGVMNIMLVSVVERRKEIGIRLAIGARRKDIQAMFLIESVTLSLFGGLLGILTGVMASFIIAEIAHWDFVFFTLPPLIGFTVSVSIGVFFGFYPAYQASRLDPIQTLRSD